MNIAIIADDLTGANDTGVQLARKGIRTAVQFDIGKTFPRSYEAIVIDSDSRSDLPGTAYRKVKQICESVRAAGIETVYKKVDSTLRGNIGAEIDAMFDVFQPDCMVIAPSFPENGRIVRGGNLFVDGVLLHETEIANDPKTPITESSLLSVLASQSARPTACIGKEDLDKGPAHMQDWIAGQRHSQVPYYVCDAETDEDLKKIVQVFRRSGLKVIWCGSAGLANALYADADPASEQQRFEYPLSESRQVMTVVGSVSSRTRQQLEELLCEPDLTGIEWNVSRILQSSEAMQEEAEYVLERVEEAHRQGRHIVLYSSGSEADVANARSIAQRSGIDVKEVSDMVSRTLGSVAAKAAESLDIRNLVLTGGDTAKQVCLSLGANELELIDEIESGVPLCRIGRKYVITKAGGFGNKKALIRYMHYFKGGQAVWSH